MDMEHSPGVLYEFAFETSSFICSYFETLLNPLVWNFFILSQTLLLWEAERENALLKVKMTGSSENIKPVVQCPCTWPRTGAAVTYRLWQNGGDCPGCLSLNHNCPRAARVASSKGSHPNRLGLDQDKHLQCCVPLPPGRCVQTAVCRLYNANGSSAPLSPCPAQGSLSVKRGLCCSLWCF